MRRGRFVHTITSLALVSALALTSAPVISAAEGVTGGVSPSRGLVSSEASVSNNGISLSVSAEWSAAADGALGIKADFDLGDVVSRIARSDEGVVEAVLAEGLFVGNDELQNVVDEWNAGHEDLGLSIAADSSWVTVAEDGARTDVEPGTDGALQLIKLAIAASGASSDDTRFELPVGLTSAASDDIRSRMDIPTAQKQVFYDATTAVINEGGTVGIKTVPGITVSVGDASASVESPVLLCKDAGSAQGVAAFSAVGRAAQDSPWHIEGFTLDRVFSGTQTFNGDDKPGHDSSANNDVIRSYDSVIYSTSYALAVEGGFGTAKAGKLHVEATLPLKEDFMTWDLDSMVWLKNTKIATDNGKQKVSGDVVFGGDSSVPVAPSVGMLNFVAKVRDVSQGQAIKAPEFSVQKYADDGTSLEGTLFECGSADPTNTIAKNANLKGSAQGRFNAQLKAEGGNRYTITLQMRSESGGLKGMALPKEQQIISVSMESNWYQDLRAVKVNRPGVAQSNGSPSNNIFTENDYGKTAPYAGQSDGSSKTTFNTIFNSGEIGVPYNKPDSTGVPARYKFAIGLFKIDRDNIDKIAPTHNSGRTSENEPADYDHDVVYNFGSYLFEVDSPKKIVTETTYVKITDLEIEDSAGTTSGDCYAEDNECSQAHTSSAPVQGNAGFHINYNAMSPATTACSTERVDEEGNLSPFDDIAVDTANWSGVYVAAPGESFVTDSQNQYFLVDDSTGDQRYFTRNDSPRYITKFMKFDDEVLEVDHELLEKVPARVGAWSENYEVWHHYGTIPVIVKYVTKPGGWTSDAELMDAHLAHDTSTHFEHGSTNALTVHDTYDQAKASGNPIVGVVYDITINEEIIAEHFSLKSKDGYTIWNFNVDVRSIPLRVKNDAAIRDGIAVTDKSDPRLVGMLTWDSTTSCVDLTRMETDGKNEYKNTNAYRRFSGTVQTQKHQWNPKHSSYGWAPITYTDYTKPVFKANGEIDRLATSNSKLNGGLDGTPASGGASFYVRLNGIDVSKEVAQQSDGTPKVNFDLDEGQRRVDFSLNALHTGSDLSKLTDTVTLTDTVPAGMNPINPDGATPAERWGIAYGGVYQQDKATNGGAGGEWVSSGGDVVSVDPANTAAWKAMQAAMGAWPGSPQLSYEVTEQSNSDGSTTLTWTFQNVPVSYRLPKIHYSVRLGSADDPFHDLANGDSVVNSVSAQLTKSGAVDSDSATVAVVRAQSAAIVKTPKVEKRSPKGTDPMGFDITFINNANDENASLQLLSVVDILPGADDGSWSTTLQDVKELEGYKLANVSFDARGFLKDGYVYLAYMVNGSDGLTRSQLRLQQKQDTLYNKMINVEYPQDGWSHIKLSFDDGGNLTKDSQDAVQNALNGKEINAVGVFTLGTTAVPPGAMFKLGYEYSWSDSSVQLAHNVSDTFTNTVTLDARELKKSVVSKATTLPTPSDMDFEFIKVDGKDGSSLAGAEFQLFRWVGNNGAPMVGLIDPNNYDDSKWKPVGVVTSGDDGKVKFEGLGSLDGSPDYRLVETKAPGGYVLPGGQWRLKVDVVNEGITINAVNGDDGTQPPAFDNSDNVLKLPNHRAMSIPSSGGRGTTLFALAGGSVCLAGLLMCILRKRPDIRARI